MTEREKVDIDIRYVQILFPIVHLEIIFSINIFLSFVFNILAERSTFKTVDYLDVFSFLEV